MVLNLQWSYQKQQKMSSKSLATTISLLAESRVKVMLEEDVTFSTRLCQAMRITIAFSFYIMNLKAHIALLSKFEPHSSFVMMNYFRTNQYEEP